MLAHRRLSYVQAARYASTPAEGRRAGRERTERDGMQNAVQLLSISPTESKRQRRRSGGSSDCTTKRNSGVRCSQRGVHSPAPSHPPSAVTRGGATRRGALQLTPFRRNEQPGAKGREARGAGGVEGPAPPRGRGHAPSVKRALPPVGWHSTAEQEPHSTTVCECCVSRGRGRVSHRLPPAPPAAPPRSPHREHGCDLEAALRRRWGEAVSVSRARETLRRLDTASPAAAPPAAESRGAAPAERRSACLALDVHEEGVG